MAEEQMEAAAAAATFQLQFDKAIPLHIKMAEWNPEKDLLAMVTDDSKVLLHRFNWQRLWTISPGKCITSICWSPDGKILALGSEDGLVLLHDHENGKMLRIIESHDVAVVCLNWAEDDPLSRLQMDTLQSRLDAEFLLAHMCSVKFKEWIVVLATLLRRAEVLVDLFRHDLRLWKAYSITLQVEFVQRMGLSSLVLWQVSTLYPGGETHHF
ncbi:anaphase-promoting complex subunit 4-like isoform X2 [Phragmites australis]|uniref:anaphase-promoting complex subunit 4-like isoform X2 n=1 Tax=Phragmites australis TaxID=29695 RepID=UPI002D775346|nr:anaphase-promoting complex subunit 4-like isoform X2 [Phragmites australis]